MKGWHEAMDRGPRWAPCVAKVGPRPGGVWSPCASPPAVLRVPSSFHTENNSCKLWEQSEKLPRTTFLKQKDSRKQEVALGILLIG